MTLLGFLHIIAQCEANLSHSGQVAVDKPEQLHNGLEELHHQLNVSPQVLIQNELLYPHCLCLVALLVCPFLVLA